MPVPLSTCRRMIAVINGGNFLARLDILAALAFLAACLGRGLPTQGPPRVVATLTGLVGSGLLLEVNRTSVFEASADGEFVLAEPEPYTVYSVTVRRQPCNPSQTCVVTNGAGAVEDHDVFVTVECAICDAEVVPICRSNPLGSCDVVRQCAACGWEAVATPELGNSTELTAVWAAGAAEAWAVGYANGTILRWDGTGWGSAAPVTSDIYYGVWGSGSDDVWVAAQGVLLHWDGGAWTDASIGSSIGGCGVWGSGPDDVWAVGGPPPSVLHWDGVAWTEASSGTSETLFGIWGSGPSDVWAVGSRGCILHWDGTAWTRAVDNPDDYGVSLSGVWGSGPDDVWAVGERSSPIDVGSGVIRHWDGTGWTSRETTPAGASLDLECAELTDVWGSGPNDVWVTGGNYVYVGTSSDRWVRHCSGILLHWDGAGWTSRSTGLAGGLRGVGGSGPNDVWAVGSHRQILHFGLPSQ